MMTHDQTKYDFLQYQICRKQIPYSKTFAQFRKNISWVSHYLSCDSWTGLSREWRAFKYIKNNIKFGHHVLISDLKSDLSGIDLISYDQNWKQKYTFQVTGFINQKSCADYIIKVDKKIYIYKNKKEIKNEQTRSIK